jgi:hypothetical protein
MPPHIACMKEWIIYKVPHLLLANTNKNNDKGHQAWAQASWWLSSQWGPIGTKVTKGFCLNYCPLLLFQCCNWYSMNVVKWHHLDALDVTIFVCCKLKGSKVEAPICLKIRNCSCQKTRFSLTKNTCKK